MSQAIEWVKWDDSIKGVKRVGPHQMHKAKRLAWPWCTRCGLIALKNSVSRAALRKPCVVWEDVR